MGLSAVPRKYRQRVTANGTAVNVTKHGWTDLPEWLRTVTELRILNLRNNKLRRLPEWLGAYPHLRELYLDNNQLTQLPETVGNLASLKSLHVNGNQLTRLPSTIGNLDGLRTLQLSRNQLTQLPDSIGNLTRLSELRVADNRLTRLPGSAGNLISLRTLQLNGNQLSRLPAELENLANLVDLILGANQLTDLPEWLGDFTKLHRLDVSDNRLIELPYRLADALAGGLTIRLDGNPLREPLPELVERGGTELITYLRSLEDAVIQYEAKLLLVGEGNVGKTSLVSALKGDKFLEDRPTTHGIEISPIPFKHPALDLDMTLRAWDFGGQQVYRVSHQFFFTPRALFLVVWHARQGEERDEVEDWLRRIKLRVGDAAVAMVVATHCSERLADLDYPRMERLFPEILAGAFRVDSRTGEGIDELQTAIGERASRLPQMGQRWSPRWTAAREAVLTLGKTEPQTLYERFAEICERNNVTGDEVSTLAKLMHDLGLIIYYDSDEGLKDVVVLNPEWLTKAISYVLDDRATSEAGGVLAHTRLKAIWQERADGYPSQYHPYFLRLMEKFDISYRLDNDETHSLVPQLAPHAQPTLPWSYGSLLTGGIRSLSLTFRLSEPAPGLVPWLTARHHRSSTSRHWRRGVFLRHPIAAYNSEALLELVRDNEMRLEVRAPSPDLYFNVLRDSIEDLITRRWPGLNYQMFVPCPRTKSNGAPCPGQFRLDGLLKVRENGRTNLYPCADCGEVYEISRLLTGFTGADGTLAVEVEQLHGQLTAIETGVTELSVDVRGLHELSAGLADVADTVRRVQRIVGTEVADCPGLFTFGRRKPGPRDRARFYRDHYQLTLWCGHPGCEHAWNNATYDLDPPKDWYVKVAPYARLVFRMLQLAVPVAAAIDVTALPAASRDDAKDRLDVMQAIIDDLPTDAMETTGYELVGREGGLGELTLAEGQALRAVRQIIFEIDPLHAFGGMRRVQAPSGELLWVCPVHYREYDPGLPTLP